jgi:putative salt-induced outer membrane protein YdiY
LIGLAVLFASPAFPRAKTDVIVMKNGDRVTGEVKSLENGILLVDLDYVDGSISIDWLKVARLESQYLFLVQLQDGSMYSAKVVTPEALSGESPRITIEPPGEESMMLERSKVVTMTQTSQSPWQRFAGDVNLGGTYTKGNSATQYNFGSELGYLDTRWGAKLTYASNLSSSTGATAATRNQLDLTAYRLTPWRNYFYAGLGSFLQSSVQGIQRQTSLGVGVGRFFKNTNRARLSVFGGVGWQGTNYLDETTSLASQQNIAVAILGSTLQIFSFKKTRLELTARLLPARGRAFSKVNTTYYLKLFGKVDWNLSFYGNWDTQPPGRLPSSDYGTSLGLSYSFGNN